MDDSKKNHKELPAVPTRDNPEQYPTENESLFDKFESQKNVDPLPMEDLKIEKREEKDGHHTKDTSSSERKYKTGM